MQADNTPRPPSGTISFLFTDIEGSTRLWQAQPEAMAIALRRHDTLLRDTLTSHDGYIFKTVGDAFFCAFTSARQALAAALDAQRALVAAPWPPETGALRVRMAIHTGTADERDGDYYGPTLNRIARLLSAGHGGQVLLSGVARGLLPEPLPAGVSLRDLGQRHLKDIADPEHIYQVVAPGLEDSFPPLRTIDAFPNNLPADLTSFIGRRQETDDLQNLISGPPGGGPGAGQRPARLVTLSGPGGTGKTRLSLHVAMNLLPMFPGGVWLVELAAVQDPALLPHTVAATLGVREEANEPITASLVRFLSDRHVLLVLDNCEHLVAACAALAGSLLQRCPQVHILASSREALGTAGEVVYPVRPLGLPGASGRLSPKDLLRYDAVRLFVERAEGARHEFRLTAGNAADVLRICRRLDGIPLAIELAAARTRVLKVSQIAARLDDRFRLLTGGSRTAISHHQTLRATIDWSYDLLLEPERALLRRLSVFAGGCRLEEIEEVCAGEGDGELDPLDILDLLDHLVAKSLISVDHVASREPRYRMLETIRQYGHVKLVEAGEAKQAKDSHLRVYGRLAEEAAGALEGPQQARWMNRLEDEYENLRAALQWAHEGDCGRTGPELALNLVQFWFTRGHYTEGREMLRTMMQFAPDDALRAQLLMSSAFIGRYQGDFEGVREATSESLAIWRRLGDRQGVADSLSSSAYMYFYAGDFEQARTLYEESLAISRDTGSGQSIADVSSHLGMIATYQGDLDAARRLYRESRDIWQTLGDRKGVAYSLSIWAEAELIGGNHRAAWQYARDSLLISRELDFKGFIAWVFEIFSALFATDRPREALQLAATAAELRAAIGHPDLPYHQRIIEERLQVARRALDSQPGDVVPLTVEQAIGLVLDTPVEPDPAAGPAPGGHS